MYWGPYVPVAERRARAERELAKQAKRTGETPSPVRIEGKAIVTTFWGKAWCENLERYSDFANRLPRGRTYVRNGSVLDLRIEPGAVRARVAGQSLYTIDIQVRRLAAARWRSLKRECTGKIGSLVGLLRGQLSADVLALLARPRTGLFPEPADLSMDCSCPDWAGMCKHIAASLYGVGARLDAQPELFFALREVDQAELISAAAETAVVPARRARKVKEIAPDQLGAVFGIDLEEPLPARIRSRKPKG